MEWEIGDLTAKLRYWSKIDEEIERVKLRNESLWNDNNEI